jgi:Ca2+-binding EF-hand superfamily protein
MPAEAWTDGKAFDQVNALRDPKLDEDEEFGGIDLGCCICKPAEFNNTWWAVIARSKVFEITTLSVIVFNALFIGYDADYTAGCDMFAGSGRKPNNNALYISDRPDALFDDNMPVGFQVVELFFCGYFTMELLIRYKAINNVLDCFFDSWFVFDSVLVFFMLLELGMEFTPGDLPVDVSIFRLLRLLRITRMGKLMRYCPELKLIVKGMMVSARTVTVTTLGPLTLVVFVFAILFTDSYHQGKAMDCCFGGGCDDPADAATCPVTPDTWEEEGDYACSADPGRMCSMVGAHTFFGSIGKSMKSLIIMGTILDDMTACTNAIRASGSKGMWMLMVFFVFVLISSFTMYNMVVGLLVEVVTATSDGEKQEANDRAVEEAIKQVFESLDMDDNGTICRKEFLQMKHDKKVLKALEQLKVESKHFDMFASLMFRPDPETGKEHPNLTLDETVSMIKRLQPDSTVGHMDFETFRHSVLKYHQDMKYSISRLDKMMSKAIDYDPDEGKNCSPETQMKLLELKALKEAEQISIREYHTQKERLLLSEKQEKMVVSDLDAFPTEDLYKEVLRRRLPQNAQVDAILAKFQSLYAEDLTEVDSYDGEAWCRDAFTC